METAWNPAGTWNRLRLTFTAMFMKSLYKGLGIEPHFSTAYHPQMQGQVKNNDKWMETYLHMFYSHCQDNWPDLLLMVEFVYNHNHHPSINTALFFVNFGYHLTLLNVPTVAQSNEPDVWICWIYKAQEECRHSIEQLEEILKQAYDKWKCDNPSFQVGDSVWLKATNLTTDKPSLKLTSKCHGPFQIKDKLSDLTYIRHGLIETTTI